MIGLAASAMSFEEASRLLWELAGLHADAKCVERAAKELGAAIAQDETARVTPPLSGAKEDTMYAGLDGTGVPMRASELAGRAGKQPDGSAKTREAKLCTIWTANSRDAQGNPVRDEGSVSYSAAIESAAWKDKMDETPLFARRVEREFIRRGFLQAKRQVFLGDGAPWIWNLADLLAPDAIQIVDVFHAKDRLSKLAAALYGANSELAKRWISARYAELDAGHVEAVMAAIDAHAGRPGQEGDLARREREYLASNRYRMDYARFRAMGLSIGSGVLEAGCRVVVAQRLKRSGMFWAIEGANAIMALRCSLLSHRFDGFWKQRKKERAEAQAR
jgi:hypothetical protein